MRINAQQADAILRANPYKPMYSLMDKERRRIAYVPSQDKFFLFKKGSRRYGRYIDNLNAFSTFFVKQGSEKNIVEKFIKKAKKATFTNSFIRNCLNADINKSCYENNLTSGTARDGEVITLDAIAKADPYIAMRFRESFAKGEEYDSPRIRFRGYDMSITTRIYDNGDKWGWLSMEYKNCGNGHYYNLINENDFIYVDMD